MEPTPLTDAAELLGRKHAQTICGQESIPFQLGYMTQFSRELELEIGVLKREIEAKKVMEEASQVSIHGLRSEIAYLRKTIQDSSHDTKTI